MTAPAEGIADPEPAAANDGDVSGPTPSASPSGDILARTPSQVTSGSSGLPDEVTPDWSFLRRPRWIISHLFVLGLVIAMVIAGLWQIDRHGERADRNDLIRARSELAPVDIADVVGPAADATVGTDQQFLPVQVTGEYRAVDEVLIRNRSLDGAPGYWVLTPLVTDAGSSVAVNRGWIPLAFDPDESRPGTEPPAGRVTIEGTIQPTRTAEGFQNADPSEGRLTSLARPDVERLAQQVDYPMAPLVVQLAEGSASSPTPIALPALDGGPHASYAAQWFIFTTIALIGYPLILRRVSRGQAESLPED